MPIYVLLAGCNELIRDTAAQLIRQLTHRVVALPDLASALEALAGIRFDILVTGDASPEPHAARLLAEAATLQPDLRVLDFKRIARLGKDDGSVGFGRGPFTLEELRSAFQLAPVPGCAPAGLPAGLPACLPACAPACAPDCTPL